MKIAEVYRTIQGEGLLTGTSSVFVRTSGCNLRCWYCDTPYTSWYPEGTDVAIDEIVAQVEEWDCRHVVVTGGEPMLFSELIPLCATLRSAGRHVTIETAGTLYLPVICDLMSISPKMSNSTPAVELHPHWSRRHDRERDRPKVVRRLVAENDYQLKFVVDQSQDLEEITDYLTQLGEIENERVLLMPQGMDADDLDDRAAWLRPYCRKHGYVFCPRKQIEWFGPIRGT